jgi:hypothetical protein
MLALVLRWKYTTSSYRDGQYDFGRETREVRSDQPQFVTLAKFNDERDD